MSVARLHREAWLASLLGETAHQLQPSTALVWGNVLNYLHFDDNEALLRGTSANMQIKTKRVSSFAKKRQLLIGYDEINLMRNPSNI